MTIPNAFTLTRYQLTLQAVGEIHLSRVKGSALRGGFGSTFKQKNCLNYVECRDKKLCPLGNKCPYGYVFETSPPYGSDVLRNLNDVPRPFIIEAPIDDKQVLYPGEVMDFGLVLIGLANEYRQNFFDAFQTLGTRVGLGKTRGKYNLLSMVPEARIDAEKLVKRASSLSANQITLTFQTPTKLKHNKKWIRSGPPFQVLIKILLGRISSLSYFHCGERLEVDFRGLIDRAAAVRIVKSNTAWEDWSRYSSRQEQRVDMGGLVGTVTYEGDLVDFLPFLALGEAVHVGKGTVFGNGQFEIIQQME